jgi:hypothetical protein
LKLGIGLLKREKRRERSKGKKGRRDEKEEMEKNILTFMNDSYD